MSSTPVVAQSHAGFDSEPTESCWRAGYGVLRCILSEGRPNLMVTVVIKDHGTVVWRRGGDVTVIAAPTSRLSSERRAARALALGKRVGRALSEPLPTQRGSLAPGTAEHAIAVLSSLPGVSWLAISMDTLNTG